MREPNRVYEQDKLLNKDHVATPRYVVENIYNLIHIEQFKNIWFPFNNYDSHFKLRATDRTWKELESLYNKNGIDIGIDYGEEPDMQVEVDKKGADILLCKTQEKMK